MEKYTYEIRPNKPFNFLDKTIKSNCSMQLSLAEAKTIVESGKARIYRIFPDINNSVKVDKGNIVELHRKYFKNKPIINRANSITDKALDKSGDKVISSEEDFSTTTKAIDIQIPITSNSPIEEKEDDNKEVGTIIENEDKSVDEEIEDTSLAKDIMPEYEEEVKEIIEKQEKVAEEIAEEEVENIIEEAESEEVSEEAVETEEEVEDEETPVEEEKNQDNSNRFYNTKIISSSNSGKKKHHKR